MKKFLLLVFTTITLSGCLPDDSDPTDFSFEILPVNAFNMPEEFTTGETYEITIEYTKPNECFEFNDFYFLANGNERIVAVIASVDNELNCDFNPVEDEATFNFFVNGYFDHYVFKFWQGRDNNGNDMYTIVEVPVVD